MRIKELSITGKQVQLGIDALRSVVVRAALLTPRMAGHTTDA